MKRKKLQSASRQKLAELEKESKSLVKLSAVQDVRDEDISDTASTVEKCLDIFKLKSVMNDIEIKLLAQEKMKLILRSIEIKEINKESLHSRAKIYRILSDCMNCH